MIKTHLFIMVAGYLSWSIYPLFYQR